MIVTAIVEQVSPGMAIVRIAAWRQRLTCNADMPLSAGDRVRVDIRDDGCRIVGVFR